MEIGIPTVTRLRVRVRDLTVTTTVGKPVFTTTVPQERADIVLGHPPSKSQYVFQYFANRARPPANGSDPIERLAPKTPGVSLPGVTVLGGTAEL